MPNSKEIDDSNKVSSKSDCDMKQNSDMKHKHKKHKKSDRHRKEEDERQRKDERERKDKKQKKDKKHKKEKKHKKDKKDEKRRKDKKDEKRRKDKKEEKVAKEKKVEDRLELDITTSLMRNGMELVPVLERVVLPEEFNQIEVVEIDPMPGPSRGRSTKREPTSGPSGMKSKANVRARATSKKLALMDHDYVVEQEIDDACDETEEEDEEYEEVAGSNPTAKRVRRLKLKVRSHIVR